MFTIAIQPEAKHTPRKARKEYRCEATGCANEIRKGDVYISEFRGGISDFRFCAECAARNGIAVKH